MGGRGGHLGASLTILSGVTDARGRPNERNRKTDVSPRDSTRIYTKEQSEELQRVAADVGRGGCGGCHQFGLCDSIIGSASVEAYSRMQMQMANNKCVQQVHNSTPINKCPKVAEKKQQKKGNNAKNDNDASRPGHCQSDDDKHRMCH